VISFAAQIRAPAAVQDAPPSRVPIRFGVFELDPEAGELRKQGLKVKLQDQPLQILRILLESPGKVVTRRELQQRIWPSDTFVDFDQGLYNATKKLREVLGDSAENPRFIETLSRRGYRFIFPVYGPAADARAASGTRLTLDSIAVLPFTSMSADPQDEFFADGVTEEVINALAQIQELHVVARTSAFSFKGRYIDVRAVGSQLNVRTLLLGSVRRADTRLRVTAQLVNVENGYHIWSERYDRDLKDIFEIQDDIARSIARRLKLALELESQEPLVKAGTKDLEAYRLYVKGRVLLYRRGAMIPPALHCFQQAVALDSEYALAWAAIADAYSLLGFYGLLHPETSRPKWQEAAGRAVVADPLLAEAHGTLAFGALMFDCDKATAEREFLCALELNPGYVQARQWYALFYLQSAAGKLAEGVAQAELALDSDPLSCWMSSMLGLSYAVAGRYSEAMVSSQRAVELDPESYLPRWSRQVALSLSGRFEEAVAAGQTALAMSGRHPWSMLLLAQTLADCGKGPEAEAVYAEMVARARREYVYPSSLAGAAGAVGRWDEALCHVREAIAIRDPSRIPTLSTYWFGKRLRMDPRIDQLLKESGIT
jgi:TolB-like protein